MSAVGYVTLEEADAYVLAHYLGSEQVRLSWESLSDESKEKLLLRSVEDIDHLPFVGRKSLTSQEHAFPRFPSATIPEAIKAAQIENALTSADESIQEDADLYRKMQMWGIKAYSMGGLSETLSDQSGGDNLASQYNIVSAKARTLLKPFMSGGYSQRV